MRILVSCPVCRRDREVDDSQASRIRTGQSSGLCRACRDDVRRPARIRAALEGVSTRFWSKVEKTPTCWLWTAAKTNHDYGHFVTGSRCDGTRRNVLAHRFAYELLVGPIPAGLFLDHLCRVRNCVNPAHLEPVTNRENLLRGKPGEARRRGACRYGHPYTEADTRWKPDGGPECRVCERKRPKRMGVCQDCGGPVAPANAPHRGVRCLACHLVAQAPEHGTRGRYAKGCRCADCRQAATAYQRIVRARKRAAA